MKAVVWTKYGSADGLHLQEVARPVPKDNQVLVRVHATTVTAGDIETRSLRFPLWLALPMRLYMGPIQPRNIILGQELAGQIVAVGKDVSRFAVGDEVFAAAGISFGGYAEYACLPEDGVIAHKPAAIRYEEAAALPTAGLEALHFLRKANIKPGEKVLIVGAGGSIGTFAVQIARNYGAEVTAVDSADKLEMLREIGADHVIDYQRQDFTRNGGTYNVIFDVIGRSDYARSLSSLSAQGRYLLANPGFSQMFRSRWTSRVTDKTVIPGPADQTADDLAFLGELMAAGSLRTIIDRRYALEQMAEAHRYVETGQKQGHVIITVKGGTA